MASYEKIVKYVVERFQMALSPLDKIVENQEKIIRQNTELHVILNKIYHKNCNSTGECLIRPEELNEPEVLTESEDLNA